MEDKVADVRELLLDATRLEQHYIGYEIDASLIPSFTHDDLINDWHIEHIRRFNSTASYLIISLNRMQYFGGLLAKREPLITQPDIGPGLVLEHRAACRDACIDIDIYIEKMKSFCRFYFFMDKEKTDNGKEWAKALRQFRDMDGGAFIERFLNACIQLLGDPMVLQIKKVRDNEMHNESPLELIHYHFSENAPVPIADRYVIENETLHNGIIHCVDLLIDTTKALQEMLVHITPTQIYQYLSSRNGKLPNIIRMEDRYKQARKYAEEFRFSRN